MTELPSHAPDSRYAWTRLALTLLAGSVACAGQWTVVVSLPIVQAEFSSLRADASLAFTLLMCGFAFGTLVMGKITDRFGIMVPVLLSAVLMAAGFGSGRAVAHHDAIHAGACAGGHCCIGRICAADGGCLALVP